MKSQTSICSNMIFNCFALQKCYYVIAKYRLRCHKKMFVKKVIAIKIDFCGCERVLWVWWYLA